MISASQSRNHVTFHMIHRDYGLIPHERERFCEIYANPECGLKTGAVSYCYCIYVRHFTFRNEVEKRLAKSWLARQNRGDFCAGPLGYRLRVFAYKLGLLERRFKQGHEILCVLAFRESGTDAAEPSVDLGLREKGVAESLEESAFLVSTSLKNRDCRLIARGLYSKYSHSLIGVQGSGSPYFTRNAAARG